MERIVKIDSVAQYLSLRGLKHQHPLIAVMDLSTAKPMPAQTFHFGVYTVFLKELKCGELKYGRSHYDYQEGTLVFIGPGQVVGVSPKTKTLKPKGWALMFHPDLIKGTAKLKTNRIGRFISHQLQPDRKRMPGAKGTRNQLKCIRQLPHKLRYSFMLQPVEIYGWHSPKNNDK